MNEEATKQVTEIRAKSPFPWRQEVNFNGVGGVRMIDAAGFEVPLLSVTTLTQAITNLMSQKAAA